MSTRNSQIDNSVARWLGQLKFFSISLLTLLFIKVLCFIYFFHRDTQHLTNSKNISKHSRGLEKNKKKCFALSVEVDRDTVSSLKTPSWLARSFELHYENTVDVERASARVIQSHRLSTALGSSECCERIFMRFFSVFYFPSRILGRCSRVSLGQNSFRL